MTPPAPPTRPLQATVIGSHDAPPETCAAAEEVGRLLARLGVTVITGGRGGVMEAACRGAVREGGIAVAILPTAEHGDANPWASVVVPTGLGHGRNVVTALAGDLLIALGGAAGTLSEICFAWLHGRPVLTLKGHGGWADRLAGEPLDPRATGRIVEFEDLQALEGAVREIAARRRA